MSEKIHKTRGIVLRTVKYGETSLIATVYTELFGCQSYLLNGIRTTSKKGSSKAAFFQPAALLEMEVYHNEFRQLHRVKEYRWAHLYRHIFTDILKHGAAIYMVELLLKCLRQPDSNPSLFQFAEDCFTHLDGATGNVMANFPVFFAVQLTRFFGFLPGSLPAGMAQHEALVFDAEEGIFSTDPVFHNDFLVGRQARLLADLLLVQQSTELAQIDTNAESRRRLMEIMECYYNRHIQDFGKLKTLPVLKEIMR